MHQGKILEVRGSGGPGPRGGGKGVEVGYISKQFFVILREGIAFTNGTTLLFRLALLLA